MSENAGLSPNELAAIEGEDETQTDDLLEAVAGEEDEAGAAAEVLEVVVAEGSDAAAAAVSTETASATATPVPVTEIDLTLPDDAAIEVPANLPVVRFQFRDDGQVLPEFAEQFSELDAKYEAGTLSLAQYNEQRDVLRAEMGNVKADAQLWEAECDTFWRHNPNWKPGSPLFDMLNGEIKRLADKSAEQGLSGIETIYAAQARVIKAIDAVRGPSATPAAAAAAAAAAASTARPASPRPAAATHALAAMPAAAAAETGKGEFAHLDNLTGLDLERAVASLSADQRDRWAQES